MTIEIPPYCLKAYALLFTRHNIYNEFKQSNLDWIVSTSMKKKIFSLLLASGWIKKASKDTYICISPSEAIKGLLNFRVPEIIQHSEKDYAFTQLSAVEVWSDFSYVQRSRERSPYFIKVLKKDLNYWKHFFNKNEIPNYVNSGTNIGEFIILIPVKHLSYKIVSSYKVEPLNETIKYAKTNEMFAYALNYIKSRRTK
jgi:hypothetical protein